jgi:hypothetical protein
MLSRLGPSSSVAFRVLLVRVQGLKFLLLLAVIISIPLYRRHAIAYICWCEFSYYRFFEHGFFKRLVTISIVAHVADVAYWHVTGLKIVYGKPELASVALSQQETQRKRTHNRHLGGKLQHLSPVLLLQASFYSVELVYMSMCRPHLRVDGNAAFRRYRSQTRRVGANSSRQMFFIAASYRHFVRPRLQWNPISYAHPSVYCALLYFKAMVQCHP